eukprot:GEMP01028794.1.p1 GENE.GEMP01028794.1~~GEMP01028794.1.p1  ORF type:complete len:478 (+),score=73.57 GEMP01028794.1:90-1523(+)
MVQANLESPLTADDRMDVSLTTDKRKVVKPLPEPLAWIRKHVFWIFIIGAFAGTFFFLLIFGLNYADDEEDFLDVLKLASIPLVSIIFTWWHVWLGIQMCWYPVEFIGCCKPYLGWQGIVPRRAHVMASRACDIMVGNLISVEEIIDRIKPEEFFSQLQPVLEECNAAVLERVTQKHFPNVWKQLPKSVLEEMNIKIMEESKKEFGSIIDELKEKVNEILDIKEMAIVALCKNKRLIVQLFQQIGDREFTFILHFAAVMGCVLGLVQLSLWTFTHGKQGAFLVLPISGTIIGYFTNMFAIKMIFCPVNPHIHCGGYINFQGVFLKRQQQVSHELAYMLTTTLLTAGKMIEFLMETDGYLKIFEIYRTRIMQTLQDFVKDYEFLVPVIIGSATFEEIKADTIEAITEQVTRHNSAFEEFADRAFALRETLSERLSKLPPEEFEGMLHPVFQEDEWIVLLLGGILGLVVGTLQTIALGL